MDYRAKELIKQGDNLFSKRDGFMNLCQQTAEQFYPERADFTKTLDPGDEFAAHLATSIPMLNRRDLGNIFSSMLRPRQLQWFELTAGMDDDAPQEAKEWLEDKQITQKNAMYDHVAGFERATKQADQDYVTFGQGPIKVEINSRDQALLIRSRHLRDVVWCEDFTGRVYKVHEKMKMTAYQLAGTFAESKLHKEVKKALAKDPDAEFNIRQVVIPIDAYERLKDAKNFPRARFVSIIVDVDNEHIIEESPSNTLKYVIPRWQTISGSQYSYSQAAIAALPEARGIQVMTDTILEAGENYVRPPLVALEESLRSDLNYYSGGVTYIDKKYNYREQGDPIRPIELMKGGFSAGLELLDRARGVLRECFFLDKVNLPVMEPGVTAYEIAQRTQEYIRNAMPLFDPVESEYNAPLCEMIFEEMLAYGFFGQDIPDSLQNQSVRFKFRSPLREAEEQAKVRAFAEGKAMIADTMQLDPDAIHMMDLRKGLREALSANGIPADWIPTEDDFEDMAAQSAQQRQMAQTMEMAGKAGAVAEQGGKGVQEINKAMQ